MAPPRKFADRDRFAEMLSAGLSAGEIARRFGGSANTVYEVAKRFGLDPRGKGWKPSRNNAEAEADEAWQDDQVLTRMLARLAFAHAKATIGFPPGWSQSRDREVVLTMGRYGEMRVLALRLEMPFARVLARWHMVRRL